MSRNEFNEYNTENHGIREYSEYAGGEDNGGRRDHGNPSHRRKHPEYMGRRARRLAKRNGMKVLAGVVAAGLIAGTAFYTGRATASSGNTADGWETIPGSTAANADSTMDASGSSAAGSGGTATSTSTSSEDTSSTDNGIIKVASSGQNSSDTSASSASSDSSDSSSGGDLTVTDVAKKGMASVVAITNTIRYQQNGYQLFGSGEGSTAEAAASGSGVIIGITDDEVLIVTNHHVIEDASELSVQFVDGTSADADIKGEDSSADLAVIAVKVSDLSSDTLNQIEAVTFADSDEAEVGEQVVAIGNALGYGQSVTTGIISAKDRTLEASDGTTEEGLLQTDAAINPGNSGGALLNMKGQLVGINVAKYSSTDVEGMGYSIPSNKVAEVVSELAEKTTRSVVSEEDRGALGITTATIDASVASTYNMPQGVYVYSIADGSAAADSDLQKGDIITAFDGQNVTDADDLSDLLKYYKAGETVTLTVERNNGSSYEEKSVEVTLGSKTSA